MPRGPSKATPKKRTELSVPVSVLNVIETSAEIRGISVLDQIRAGLLAWVEGTPMPELLRRSDRKRAA